MLAHGLERTVLPDQSYYGYKGSPMDISVNGGKDLLPGWCVNEITTINVGGPYKANLYEYDAYFDPGAPNYVGPGPSEIIYNTDYSSTDFGVLLLTGQQ